MSYYKVTFAVESKALGPTLETLSLGIREGVISKSFVVEREEESLSRGARVEEPPRIPKTPKISKIAKLVKVKRRRASKGSNPAHGQLAVIIDHIRKNGSSARHSSFGRALAAAGFSRNGAGSALKRALLAGHVVRVGMNYEIAPAPE